MKKQVLPLFFLTILLFVGCKSESSTQIDDFSIKVDSLFNDWDSNQPGGAVAVIHEGNLQYEDYFGLESLESKKRFDENTLIDIGSISKQFTASLIALLEEANKLSIEDDIRKYFPEFPDYLNAVKIKHLIYHTSGIRDYEALEMLKGNHYFGNHMTNQYVVDLISRQKSLNFKPNTRYEYSNSNYILLAEIVERVSGKTLNEFAKEQLFDPLEMTRTFFHIDQGEDFKNRAIGYDYADSIFIRPEYNAHLIGDGGLFTSLPDMIKWDANFYENKLGNKTQSLIQRMAHREKLSNGNTNNMAFAQIFTTHSFGQNSFSHGGSGGGYRSFYVRFDAARFSVIVLGNTTAKNAFEKANKIVDLFFEVKHAQPQAENTDDYSNSVEHIQSSETMIKAFTGFYREIEGLAIAEVHYDQNDDTFVVNWLENRDGGYKARPISNTVLAELEDANYQYKFDVEKKAMLHYDNGHLEKEWKKLSAPTIKIEKFKGRYYSEEIEHQLEFSVSKSKLYSKNRFLGALKRIGNTTFLDEHTLSIVTFALEDNEVMGFSIDIPQGDRNLRGLKFNKIH